MWHRLILWPRPHIAGYFRKRRFFSPHLKNLHPHVAFLNRIWPFTHTRVFSKTEILPGDSFLRIKKKRLPTHVAFWIRKACNPGMTTSHLKISVLVHSHKYDKSPFSKISTLENIFENLRFRCPKMPATCNHIRRKKSPFSKILSCVWTGSKSATCYK